MFKIVTNDGVARVYTPYNSEFVRRIKNIGGARWDGSAKCWTIPADAVQECRKIMTAVYGQSDLPDAGGTVKLRLTVHEDILADRDDVKMFAKSLCRATGRDSGGRPGQDVIYTEGEPQSGGSVKYWCSVVPAGSVLTLSNVPRRLWESYSPDEEEREKVTVELIDSAPSRAAMIEEREKLIQRIAEIDRMLKEVENEA